MLISLEFQEAYKRLDKICKECLSSNEGVSEYIRLMESQKLLGKRYVPSWEYDYKMLKHERWIRNQFSHEVDTLQSDICSQSDLNYVKNFYNLIINCSDPLTILRKEKEKVKRQRFQNTSALRTSKSSSDPSYSAKEFNTISESEPRPQIRKTPENKKSFFSRLKEKIKKFFS